MLEDAGKGSINHMDVMIVYMMMAAFFKRYSIQVFYVIFFRYTIGLQANSVTEVLQ
jgi:hypothetical protein